MCPLFSNLELCICCLSGGCLGALWICFLLSVGSSWQGEASGLWKVMEAKVLTKLPGLIERLVSAISHLFTLSCIQVQFSF